MNSSKCLESIEWNDSKTSRSQSARGLDDTFSSLAMPLPPQLWITDVEDESSDEAGSLRDDGVVLAERARVRSRFRHYKQRSINVPLGIFWDIENCQVPRGCSAIDVVAAIRAKFLVGRREADFLVVCDVRKEQPHILQDLNDAQISLIHVCGTQKNAADEKLRQCMRRFGELHPAPAALLLISGDINFAADLCDFRHRKNMEVILVHKQNTSSALIACASSHYCFNELTADLPRNPKSTSHTKDEEEPICEMEVDNLPLNQPPDRVSRRLRRLAENCGGKVLRVTQSTAVIKFPTPEHASRALKRMDGEDVFGRKISTRYARSLLQPTYSSDEGYSTATALPLPLPRSIQAQPPQVQVPVETVRQCVMSDWAMALQQLPAPVGDFCVPMVPKPRKIRGTHGSSNLDRSGCSSSNSSEEGRARAVSPWNSSTYSEHSESDADCTADLTVTNLPPFEPPTLQEMLSQVFSQYVPVVRVSVWTGGEGPLATVVLRSEWDARLAIARVHKRRLDHQWAGRRLELSLGKPSPAPNLDVLRARLRAILLDQKGHALPLLRLRDAYASRHCCSLTTSDIAKVKDTVIIHEGFGRMVQLIDLTPVTSSEMEEAPWKCHIHASLSTCQEDGSRILQPVYMEIAALANNVQILLEEHGGILPLLSFVECYEARFPALSLDLRNGVALELLLRSVPVLEVKDSPSRHLTLRNPEQDHNRSDNSDVSRWSGERERARTAPALEPMLALFERELIDLLRTAPRCSIPFSKLIPAFHHHFGRQCRVADYGFTKLPDLLAALGNTIVVLGSGSSRVITISGSAQSKRWTSDLIKLLKAYPGRSVHIHELPQLYREETGRDLSPADYGVCTVRELMQRVCAGGIVVGVDGSISLPRRTPTPDERARTVNFAAEAIELLCYTPNFRMEFSRFVPAYHAHFGRQLRVAHYGCVKLVELFELIPDSVAVYTETSGERAVKLTPATAAPVFAQRLAAIAPVSVAAFAAQYARQFGAMPLPEMLEARTQEELVAAGGGMVQSGVVLSGAGAARWARGALAACAALCADPSVARGSTDEYFAHAYRCVHAAEPDMEALVLGGVLQVEDRRVRLAPRWRCVWRVALILADAPQPLAPLDIYHEYVKRFEPVFPGVDDWNGMMEFMRAHREVFAEVGGARWAVRADVAVPRPPHAPRHEDYSLHDTPPGQKGSRVFDSPKTNIWCSPPASALPAPSALLMQEKRRTRLAAQFDAS